MKKIETEEIIVEIDELGAQITSIKSKKDNLEFLWQKDPSYWSSSAPVPFPIIGRLNNNITMFDGKEYSMKSNGIIRYVSVPVTSQEKNQVEFEFTSTNETKSNYPFECKVRIRFEVQGKELKVTTTILNEDVKTMYYNYAGHPGFRVPLLDGESSNDYYIEFEKPEHASVFLMADTGQLLPDKKLFFNNESRFFIRKELFKREAIAFIKPESSSVYLKNIKNPHEIKVNFKGFDNLALWTPCKEGKEIRLICIEPWAGHSDFKGNIGEFKNRDGIFSLEPGCHAEFMYSILIK